MYFKEGLLPQIQACLEERFAFTVHGKPLQAFGIINMIVQKTGLLHAAIPAAFPIRARELFPAPVWHEIVARVG